MEGKGQAAYSEGITDTVWGVFSRFSQSFVKRVNSLTGILGSGRDTGGRGKQVVVGVWRRVRMGKKDEVGSPYILSPDQVT